MFAIFETALPGDLDPNEPAPVTRPGEPSQTNLVDSVEDNLSDVLEIKAMP